MDKILAKLIVAGSKHYVLKFTNFLTNLKMLAFWDVAPCSLSEVDRCFKGAYLPDDGGSTHL
jgi:hypothetical protein